MKHCGEVDTVVGHHSSRGQHPVDLLEELLLVEVVNGASGHHHLHGGIGQGQVVGGASGELQAGQGVAGPCLLHHG